MCHNIEPTSHRTTFTGLHGGFLYHLASGLKIDITNFIYDQIHTLGVWGDRHNALIFPSLIIYKVAGVPIPSGEVLEKTSVPIRCTILEAHDRTRVRHQKLAERARRQQSAIPGQEGRTLRCYRHHYHLLMVILSY